MDPGAARFFWGEAETPGSGETLGSGENIARREIQKQLGHDRTPFENRAWDTGLFHAGILRKGGDTFGHELAQKENFLLKVRGAQAGGQIDRRAETTVTGEPLPGQIEGCSVVDTGPHDR